MRIVDALRVAIVIGGVGFAGAHVLAFDGTPSSPRMINPLDAARQGTEAFQAGNLQEAIASWTKAAELGHIASQWQLGRLFAGGDGGVQRDDLKAFHYFSQIVETHGDDEPTSPQAQYARSAFVRLGSYYLAGIPGTEVKQDFSLAWRMFYHAASVFGDSEAQYQIGRMYLDGTGVEFNPRMAANWLRTAADKGHVPAQATLGELLFVGRGQDLPRRPVEGLMWLSLAREKARMPRDAWIATAFDDAWTLASDEEHAQAATLVRRAQHAAR